MPVEFRCPDCRAKLRLADAPPPGDDVECPKCGNVFPAPDLAAAAPAVRKKRPPIDDDVEEVGGDDDEPAPKRKPRKPKPAAGGPTPPGPKRRKAKKKKADPRILVAGIVGGVLALGLMVFTLVYVLGRQGAAVEMMAHLPADADTAWGTNYTQFQKYKEFYKDFDKLQDGPAGLKKRLEPITKALKTEFNDFVDYAVGGGKTVVGDETRVDQRVDVVRSKKEFDPAQLKDIAGAKSQSADGTTYYEANFGPAFGVVRVFAPTNRLIVLAPASMPAGKFTALFKPAKEGGFIEKSGTLGKRCARGNQWCFTVADGKRKGNVGFLAAFDPPTGADPKDTRYQGLTRDYKVQGTRGSGYRFNMGAREVKFEVVCWYAAGTEDQISEHVKAWNKSDMIDKEEIPGWWKTFTNAYIGEAKLDRQLRSNLDPTAAGDLFVMRTAANVEQVKEKMSATFSKFNPAPGTAP